MGQLTYAELAKVSADVLPDGHYIMNLANKEGIIRKQILLRRDKR